MEKKYDVTALGELLIDFTSNGCSNQGNPLFEANPGGAPCNVLSMLNKLGRRTAFIGKVGDDMFGHRLKSIIEDCNINADHLVFDSQVRTTLAFVHTLEDGDRDFSFYRNPGADMMLCESEVDEEVIKESKLFHFGTLSMTNDDVRNATKKAIKIAKENNLLVSFDPNLRPPLWASLDLAREQFHYGFSVCDILKISDDELTWFTGEEDLKKGIEILRSQYQPKLILLTLGKDGSCAYYNDLMVEMGSIRQSSTVDTTGAGDTFFGCCLHYVLKYGIDQLDDEKLKEMLVHANAAASIITTKKGALVVMPEVEEIEGLIEKKKEN